MLAQVDPAGYRVGQVMKWIYHSRVTDVHLMTNLAKELRNQLAAATVCTLPTVQNYSTSIDGTVKWIMKTSKGGAVESVLIPDGRRNTLCISSQLGCSLNCEFCATGKQGFGGNLAIEDIVGQVVVVDEWLRKNPHQGVLTNIVFMGMGEPLMNFDAVMSACDIFTDDLAFGLSRRRVTVSTAGVVPRILEMCGRTQASLAVSLHAPNDELRNRLVPINRKYPIAMLLDACRTYLNSLNDRRIVTIEYTLIHNTNDSVECAAELAYLLKDLRCKVNLIPYNPISQCDLLPPTEANIGKFYRTLMGKGIMVTRRTTRGQDINAACGQLVGNFDDTSRRRQRHQSLVKYQEASTYA